MRSRFGVVVGAITLVAGMMTAAPVAASAGGPNGAPAARPVMGFQALNHFVARRINAGSIEPPEQGLCAGSGYVLESVTGAIVVYDSHGNIVKAPTTLNSFYGYPPAMAPMPPPAPPVFGPQLTDPTCYFDGDTQRWFQAVLTMETVPTGRFMGQPTGVNHIDIAVSQTADPAGAWSVHKLYAPDDCPATSTPWVTDSTWCLGDFPHIGANADGFFVTTNVYDFFDPAFHSAHVYAFSKHALETDAANAQATEIDTANRVGGSQAGFTVWPAQAPSGMADGHGQGDLDTSRGGTEFFLSSNAADEVNAAHTGSSHDVILWSLSGTQSLDSDDPALTLTNTMLAVGGYAVPPAAHQKAGDTPLADCLNDTTTPVTLRPGMTVTGCWHVLLPPNQEPSHTWTEGQSIDTGDTRMQQVMFAGGLVYGALGTAVDTGGEHLAGIEWFAVRPHVTAGGDVHAQVVNQGYVSRPDTALSVPAIAVNNDGVGAIGFSLMGPNDYPSAAYVPFDVKAGTGDITIAAAGKGPDDGFTNYAAAFHAPPRTRWGDYAAAVADGSHFWFASEYIAQTCTFDEWLAMPLGTCGGTRAGSANWATHIAELVITG